MIKAKAFRVLGISGSLRAKSLNLAAVKYAGTVLPAGRATFEIANLLDIPVYNSDVEDKGMPASVSCLHAKILAADGIIIGSPEFNYSITGPLKNAIDWVSRVKGNPWDNKPVAIICCTASHLGGLRSIYELS